WAISSTARATTLFPFIKEATERSAMNENVIGREVWVEMDEDKSATRFSPRKGMVVHIFGGRPEVQEVVVRLMPPALRFLPIPHRMRHIVLRYRFREKEN